MSVEGEVTMKTFLRRLILETEGQQLIPYTLVGVVVTLIVINADRVAQGLNLFADLLRTVAGQLDFLW